MKYLVLLVLAGCMVGDAPDDLGDEDLVDTSAAISAFATRPGVNSGECTASPYNCRFRAGSSRVQNAAGGEEWAIVPGASVRDDDGNVLAVESGSKLTFNYGQTRELAGKAHALALTTSNSSAGWCTRSITSSARRAFASTSGTSMRRTPVARAWPVTRSGRRTTRRSR
jgi:hypothetical protein